ncbi:hypothetical protein DM01DRAFT_1409953 [Hesseltinella vesiculosa]|uniref:PX domain-containing protein n=1 Tax=Hesseltinella vesiculosa TaxID=101127 RepID=A0A1X2G998_9FUNG|nr:hypothetical protein DM01DRAFT_1409953 [Hesseltinella vesiculosa]
MHGLELLVPEAAASVDSIQFKLILGGTHQQAYLEQHATIQPTVFRSFQQIAWLHEQLGQLSTVFIPALPEPPKTDMMDDQDYVERKRLQVARYFEKLIQRPPLYNYPSFVHFLSNDMPPSKLTRAKFHSYKVMEPVEGDENELFHRHQIYILMLESYFGAMAESLERVIQLRDGLADTLTDLGDTLIETTQSKYQLGEGISYKDLQRALDRKMQLFGMLMDELGFLITRQGKEEAMEYGDVVLGYKDSMDGLKTIFNTRTQRLMEYVESAKNRSRKRDRTDRLKLRMGLHANEVQAALAEEQQATDALAEHKKEFDTCQSNVKEEMRLFEGQKTHDLLTSMTSFARLQLRYEKGKLQALEKTLSDIQLLQPSSLRHSSLTMPTPIYQQDPVDHTKKQRRPKTRQQNTSPPQRTLQSSASLPTWRSREDDDEEVDEEDHDQEVDPLTGNRVTTLPIHTIITSTVPVSASSSHHDRRPGVSLSYDDRFRKSTHFGWSS